MQEQILFVLTGIYFVSSWIGAILFTFIWRLTHADRVELKADRFTHSSLVDSRVARLRRAAAWRNEYIAGIMALAFWLYAMIALIAAIQILGVDFPWVQGLVISFLLVAGNAVEMTVALVLIYARVRMGRGQREIK